MGCKMCHLVIDGDAGKDGCIALGVWLALLHNKQNRKGTFIHRCNYLCYVRKVGLLHRVADSLRIMQHTVPKRFIWCKHNTTLPNTQVFGEEFVTFFTKVKSWSQHALFVWDLICCGKRIASNCARFYRIAECVTARI